MTTPKLPGQVPSNEQEQLIQNAADHWRTVGNEAPVQAITRIEEAAKQLIGLTTLLQGIYFAIFAFSDVRKQVGALNLPIPHGLVLLLFFLPLLLWLISLYCATRVFVPQPRPEVNLNDMSISGWQNIKQTYEQTAEKKLRWLRWSHMLLVISFGVLVILLVVLALLPPPPASGPTQIIIVTPTPAP